MKISYKLNTKQKRELYQNIDREFDSETEFIAQKISLFLDTSAKTAEWICEKNNSYEGSITDDYQGCIDWLKSETRVQIFE